MKTWTVQLRECVLAVSADDVEVAKFLILTQHGIRIKNEDLIPFPTRHRYVKKLNPKGRPDDETNLFETG